MKRKAFSLAETMITLVILGLVAAIAIPIFVSRNKESEFRTKFKKAIVAYEEVINKIIIENNIKSNDTFSCDGNFCFTQKNDCSKTSVYFKILKPLSDDNGTNCRFSTSDGVFWDISDIQKPIIALREIDLTDDIAQSDTNRAFYLYAEFDDKGSIRITEPNYKYSLETPIDLKEINDSVSRLWTYIYGKSSMSFGKALKGFERCKARGEATCTVKNQDGEDVTYSLVTVTDKSCANNSNILSDGSGCTSESFYAIAPVYSHTVYGKYATDCERINSDYCRKTGNADYWAAANYYCTSQGGKMATAGQVNAAGYSSSAYWVYTDAAEHSDSQTVNRMDAGKVEGRVRFNSYTYAFCVGN